MTNFQRAGSKSNTHVGAEFEHQAVRALAREGISVARGFSVEIGVSEVKKNHTFDLGSSEPPVLVECKSHRWTAGNNVPSAKMTVWNEAMYYFHCAPPAFRKILFVLRDQRQTTGETLASYYVRTYGHLIPAGVEIWELDQQSGACDIVYGT